MKGKAIRDPDSITVILFSKLNWLFWIKYFVYKPMIYKSLNNLAHYCMSDMFSCISHRKLLAIRRSFFSSFRCCCCLYNSLFYKIFNTQGIQSRCYKFYLAILACPYLIIHIIQLCTLKIVISEFDLFIVFV